MRREQARTLRLKGTSISSHSPAPMSNLNPRLPACSAMGPGSPKAPRRTAGGTGNSLGVRDGSRGPARTEEGWGRGARRWGLARTRDGSSVRHEVCQTSSQSVRREGPGTQPSGRRPAAHAATRATPPARTHAPKAQEQEQAPSREWGTPGFRRAPWWSEERVAG